MAALLSRERQYFEQFLSRALISAYPGVSEAFKGLYSEHCALLAVHLRSKTRDDGARIAEFIRFKRLMHHVLDSTHITTTQYSPCTIIGASSSLSLALESVFMCLEAVNRYNALVVPGSELTIGVGVVEGRVMVVDGSGDMFGDAADSVVRLVEKAVPESTCLVLMSPDSTDLSDLTRSGGHMEMPNTILLHGTVSPFTLPPNIAHLVIRPGATNAGRTVPELSVWKVHGQMEATSATYSACLDSVNSAVSWDRAANPLDMETEELVVACHHKPSHELLSVLHQHQQELAVLVSTVHATALAQASLVEQCRIIATHHTLFRLAVERTGGTIHILTNNGATALFDSYAEAEVAARSCLRLCCGAARAGAARRMEHFAANAAISVGHVLLVAPQPFGSAYETAHTLAHSACRQNLRFVLMTDQGAETHGGARVVANLSAAEFEESTETDVTGLLNVHGSSGGQTQNGGVFESPAIALETSTDVSGGGEQRAKKKSLSRQQRRRRRQQIRASIQQASHSQVPGVNGHTSGQEQPRRGLFGSGLFRRKEQAKRGSARVGEVAENLIEDRASDGEMDVTNVIEDMSGSDAGEETIHFTVRVQTDTATERAIPLTCSASTDVWQVKLALERQGVGQAGNMVLEDSGHEEMDDEGTLAEHGVGNGSVITLVDV